MKPPDVKFETNKSERLGIYLSVTSFLLFVGGIGALADLLLHVGGLDHAVAAQNVTADDSGNDANDDDQEGISSGLKQFSNASIPICSIVEVV